MILHARKVFTWEAEARYVFGKPILGCHATSLTQSEWPDKESSSTQAFVSSFQTQVLTLESHPPVANFLTIDVEAEEGWDELVFEAGVEGFVSAPGRMAGAQEMAVTPTECAVKREASHVPSSFFKKPFSKHVAACWERFHTIESQDGYFAVWRSTR